MFCDYEHIHPEYHNATEHNPECMTLLCGGCHHGVTGKRISKKTVWKAKENPFAIEHGYVKEIIEPARDDIVTFGDSVISASTIAVELSGKPVLWFEKPTEQDEPILVNAIFNDSNGQPLAFINRNQFTAIVDECDIKSEGTTIEFRPRAGEISLILDVDAGQAIGINRLNMSYLDTQLKVLPDKSMYLTQGGSTIRIGKLISTDTNCAITLGQVPKSRCVSIGTRTKVNIALEIAKNTYNFTDLNGSSLGWVSGVFIINNEYDIVGMINGKNTDNPIVQTITGEFIGHLFYDDSCSYSVEMKELEYETYEPIWQSSLYLSSRIIRTRGTHDLSHRLFGANSTHLS
jgi:hypothetical protein